MQYSSIIIIMPSTGKWVFGCDVSPKLDKASESEIMTIRKKRKNMALCAKLSPLEPDPMPTEINAKTLIDPESMEISVCNSPLLIYTVHFIKR